MGEDTFNIGVIGCGGFGLFALQHFTQIPNVDLVGMSGTHRQAAYAAAQRFGVPDIQDVDKMLDRDEIDLVYISTPPFLHYEQGLKALKAGKHVIVEKPLALTVEQADEMVEEARKRDLLVVANLMQRYNPIYQKVKELIESQALGELLHAFFENYASDEGLAPEHWFWDREKSGGIFIEHGVHFFDMFEGWLGPGKVEAAQVSVRPGSGIEDQVQCTVRYGDTVLANFYHGFTQPGRLDRQELRLLFERGDVSLFEWIPVQVKIHAVADEADTRKLTEIFPGSQLDVTEMYSGKYRTFPARHKDLDVYHLFDMEYGLGKKKWNRYGELVRALFRDQLAWVQDRSHARRVTEANGRDSVAVAVEADRLAH